VESLDYLEDIKRKHNLTNEALVDILEHIGYIARDNGLDDSVIEELLEEL